MGYLFVIINSNAFFSRYNFVKLRIVRDIEGIVITKEQLNWSYMVV